MKLSKILLSYFSFVIACVVVILGFITASNYIQLAGAILLYPLLVFFAYKIFPRKYWQRSSKKPAAETVSPKPEKIEELKEKTIGISDIDKRVFLKLIGGAGLFLFLFSIFNKRAESLFFKNIPSTGTVALEDISGNKINPAQAQPLDGYRISEIEDNLISFYGFTNNNGAWYVMKVDTNTGSFRYATGESNFPGNWSNREKLKYDYFNNIF